jgi:pyruvate,water dikinase
MERLIQQLRSLFHRGPRTPAEFERLFRRFRGIMDSNTRALEIITEMGDILGGDYLFDIQYVRKAYGLLHEQLERSIELFDKMSGGRAVGLHEAAARIDGTIRRAMEGGGTTGGEVLVWLDVLTTEQARDAGGKMANLADVKQHLPLRVPDGFIVTLRGFDAYLRHNHLLSTPDGGSDREWYERMTDAVLRGEMPPELHRSFEKAVTRLRSRCGRDCTLAVRSSAGEEDGEYSFAGQYETVLNVPPDVAELERAYRQVVASLYSERAAAYQRRFGFDPGSLKMAVGVLAMVDAAASGVLYTADPLGRTGAMVVNSAWGLGTSVVDGTVDADQFIVGRDGVVIEGRTGRKTGMAVRRPAGGIAETETPEERRLSRSLTDGQIAELARAGTLLEGRFGGSQDVEWTFDAGGNLFILQSRPLRMQDAGAEGQPAPVAEGTEQRVLFRNAGIVVQKGFARGAVHIVRNEKELDGVPRGAVLVVKHDSPNLVRVMPEIAAIITDTGSLTSHMASLAREFRVPTAVNIGDATKVLTEGKNVTVVLADHAAVYEGTVAVPAELRRTAGLEDLYEFRRKRYILRHIAPLNLVDPFRDDFSPGACRTLHDILRFIHEKAVGLLIEAAGFGTRSRGAVKLDLPIPAGLTVIDIGGGMTDVNGQGHASPEQVASLPLRAIIAGMTHPGVWRSEAVPLSVNDFLTSMFRAPDLMAESDRQSGTNVAVVSREYTNLNIKFGYHYTIIDSYVSEVPRSNHIYFRFAGGATDMTKRSRRLRVIAAVLEEQGFSISTKGDMIIARLSNAGREEMEALLEGVGRLISYTRQLDAVLRTDDDVTWFTECFLQGKYELKGRDVQD